MDAQIPTIETLIAWHNLGRVKKVYKAHIVSALIVGLIFAVMGGTFFILTLPYIFDSLSIVNPMSFYGLPLFAASNAQTLIGSVSGLIFCTLGIKAIIKALDNQHTHAALCEHGIAYIGAKGADAFRWEHVVIVLTRDQVHVKSRQRLGIFMNNTRVTVSHTYTVVCKDGRRFIFTSLLGQVDQLAEEIQIAVALNKEP